MGLISFIKNAGAKIFKSEEKREEGNAEPVRSNDGKVALAQDRFGP